MFKIVYLEKFLSAIILCICLYKLHTIVTIPTEIVCLNNHLKTPDWVTNAMQKFQHLLICIGV